jgi:hypothetical protein
MTQSLKTLPLLAMICALAPAAAARADDAAAAVRDSRLEKAFGSTIVSTYPDGRQAELWLQRDGAYTAEGRRHDRSSGTWQVKQDKGASKLCLKQRRPFPAPFSYCTGVPDGGLDSPWTGKAYTGEQISIRVVRGIYDPAAKDETKDSAKAAESGKTRSTRPDDQG